MSGRRLGPEPPPKLWRHGHGHDGSAMPKRIHVDCNSDHRMRNGDRSAILDRHSEDLVAAEAGHGDASVRDPHTQIAAGLEQLVILTRVTLGDLYSRKSMVSDPPADPTARKPTRSYRPRA